MSKTQLIVGQVNLVVSDLAAAVAFYRLVGLNVDEIDNPLWKRHHARVIMPGGVRLELDSVEFARQWNPGFKGQPGNAGCVLFFLVPSRIDVDLLFAKVTAYGYPAQKPPEDAFWGARYAVVEDPDGNAIGFMSEIDPARRHTPPPPPK
jgi:catechol 2,3-dioxygenase-like lactoylglutathione lyase family enzyme